MEVALIENLQREDLNPVEEAEGLKSLIESYGFTQEEAADKVGVPEPMRMASSSDLLSDEMPCLMAFSRGRSSSGHSLMLRR